MPTRTFFRCLAFSALSVFTAASLSCSSSTSPGEGGGGGGDDDGTTFFVSLNGSGAGTGDSWDDAFTSLQAAVDAAEPGDGIWVCEGTYTSGAAESSVPVVELAPGVEIYGGFDGTETDLSERDPDSNPAVFDGQGNAFHVVVGADGAVLDGFTITGGNADGTGDNSRGGGVFMSGVSMTIADCIIENNNAYIGAGIYARSDSSSVVSTVLRNNTATFAEGRENGGGGIAATGGSRTSIDGCYFYRNTSGRYGGAIHASMSKVAVGETVFEENSITLANSNGGCVYVENDNSTGSIPSFTDCEFTGNSGGYGGAMFLTRCYASVISCIFSDNTAGNGGGAVNCYNASLDLRHSIFSSNSAVGAGAVYFYGQSGGIPVDVFNCLFDRNSASGNGGAMIIAYVSPNITSCTIAGNSATTGGGINVSTDAFPVLTNSILWGNTSSYGGNQIDESGTGDPAIQNCCIDQAGYSAEGNSIRSDPLWVTGPAGDYYLSQADAGQTGTSACVDAGIDLASAYLLDVLTTRTDQVGDAGTVDIGFHYPRLPVPLNR